MRVRCPEGSGPGRWVRCPGEESDAKKEEYGVQEKHILHPGESFLRESNVPMEKCVVTRRRVSFPGVGADCYGGRYATQEKGQLPREKVLC